MRTWLRPVTFCVVLLFGAGPAATIACELACVSPSGHSGHHDSAAHQHGRAVGDSDSASSPGEFLFLSASASNCDHVVVGSLALTSSAVKVFAPIAVDVPDTAVPDGRYTHGSSVASLTASPPGVRSGPLPLRI